MPACLGTLRHDDVRADVQGLTRVVKTLHLRGGTPAAWTRALTASGVRSGRASSACRRRERTLNGVISAAD